MPLTLGNTRKEAAINSFPFAFFDARAIRHRCNARTTWLQQRPIIYFNTDLQVTDSGLGWFFPAVSVLLCNLCFDQVQGRLIQTICNLSCQRLKARG